MSICFIAYYYMPIVLLIGTVVPSGPSRRKDSAMSITSRAGLSTAGLVAIFTITLSAWGQSVDGTWDATVTVNNVSVPFRVEIDGAGAVVHSYFFNGDERVNPSNSGTFQNGSLVLNFDSYATKLEATLNDGIFTGTYRRRFWNIFDFLVTQAVIY